MLGDVTVEHPDGTGSTVSQIIGETGTDGCFVVHHGRVLAEFLVAVSRPQRVAGIHGQMVYANRDTGLVGAKLSSWPEPQHATKLFSALRAFDAISALRA